MVLLWKMASTLVIRQIVQFPSSLLSSKCFNTKYSYQIKCFTNSSVKNIPNQGNFFNVSNKGVSKLKMRDNMPDNYTLIYKAPMELTLRMAYPIILFCTTSVPLFALVDYLRKGKLDIPQVKTADLTTPRPFVNSKLELCIFTGAIILLAAGSISVIFKFPFRVYKHKERKEYIGLFLSTVPAKLCNIHFKNASQTNFKNPLYFFMKDCHYMIENKKSFFLAHYFRTPSDLSEMLGVK